MGYDADGNRTSAAYPNGTSTGYTYDARNRLTSMTTVAGATTVQSFAYMLDPAGRRTQETDGDGTVRVYGYDGIDRLTSEAVTGSLSYAKAFAYDPVGNRSTQTTTGAGAATVTYSYDVRDRLTTENTTGYGYDANGNVTSKSGEATYGWDFDNRLTAASMTSGALVEHQYDADGNRVKTTVTQPAGGSPVACSGNSAVFLRTNTSVQGNWKGAYGADGQYISGETPSAPSYGSVAISNATQLTTSDGTNDGRALQQPDPQTSRILSAWRSPSETFHVTTTDGNAHTVAFYMLDVYSEATAQTVTAQTTSAQVLDAARPFAGIQSGTWVVYSICGSVDFVFTGTAGNNGVYASVSGVFFGPPPGVASTTNMLVDASGGLSQVVAETDGSGKLTAYYVRAGDELLEVMRPGSTPGTWNTRFVHRDGLGSVRALTDETATTTDTRGYEAFGTKNTSAGTDALAYGFAGEPFEPTSMLAYHRARWMDSRVGRFAGMDQVDGINQRPLSWHRYIYTSDEPVAHIDPSGNFGIGDIGFAAIAVVALAGCAEPNYGRFLVPNLQGQGATYSGPPFDSEEQAMLFALKTAIEASVNGGPTTRVAPGEPDSTTNLLAEYGGVTFRLPSGKFGFSLLSSGFATKTYADEVAKAAPANTVLTGFLHTHPNYGSYLPVSGTEQFFEPFMWSAGDIFGRSQVISAMPALSLDFGIVGRARINSRYVEKYSTYPSAGSQSPFVDL